MHAIPIALSILCLSSGSAAAALNNPDAVDQMAELLESIVGSPVGQAAKTEANGDVLAFLNHPSLLDGTNLASSFVYKDEATLVHNLDGSQPIEGSIKAAWRRAQVEVAPVAQDHFILYHVPSPHNRTQDVFNEIQDIRTGNKALVSLRARGYFTYSNDGTWISYRQVVVDGSTKWRMQNSSGGDGQRANVGCITPMNGGIVIICQLRTLASPEYALPSNPNSVVL